MEDDAHGGAPNFSWKPLGRSTADVFMVALLEAVALLPVPPAIRPSWPEASAVSPVCGPDSKRLSVEFDAPL